MDDIKKLLGRRIKELRRQKGLTQEKLAELINIDQRNLSNIECGITFPSRSLLALSKALNIELPQLFEFDHNKYNLSDMKTHIVNMLNCISDRDIKIIYRLLKSMI